MSDAEGELEKDHHVHDILYSFSFEEEPSQRELNHVVGEWLKKNYTIPIIKNRMMYDMFRDHDENQSWGKDPKFLQIELKISENIEDSGEIDYDKLMSSLNEEEVYSLFSFLVGKLNYSSSLTVKKIDIHPLKTPLLKDLS